MPHTDEILPDGRAAVVSCHVERPLDDRCWSRFARLQEGRPGGFRIAALLRPPEAGEDAGLFLERAREAAARAPLGHHTHFTSATHARPTDGDAAGRVRREGEWLREHGLEPTLFCGGGWYLDQEVAVAAAELGYADCSATAFRPSYLGPGAAGLTLASPTWLRLDGTRLLELPSTHSLGMLARAALDPRRLREPVVHAYFHDTDLLDRRRRTALVAALALLGRRRRATDLDRLAEHAARTAPELRFGDVARD